MKPVRKKFIVCSCATCRDLEARYDLEPLSCRISFSWPNAVIPRLEPFTEETLATLFTVFSIPKSYEYVDYTQRLNQSWRESVQDHSQPKEMVAFFGKFVDPIQKYQSGEMFVLEEGQYFYCVMGFFEKFQKGDEDRYDLTDWTTTKMAGDLTLMRRSVREIFDDLPINRSKRPLLRFFQRVLRKAKRISG